MIDSVELIQPFQGWALSSAQFSFHHPNSCG
jgi:hypothetical protein